MIIYLSKEDRKRIIELRETYVTSENAENVAREMAEIESRRKTISECNLDELNDLKNQYTNQMMMLNSMGKSTPQYIQSIRIIDEFIMHETIKATKESKTTKKRVEKQAPSDNYNWMVDFDENGT